MNNLRNLLMADLALMVGFTLYAVLSFSSIGETINAFTADMMVMQVTLDLVVSLGLLGIAIWFHARRNGINPIPYLVGILMTGSIAVIVYALVHVVSQDHCENTAVA